MGGGEGGGLLSGHPLKNKNKIFLLLVALTFKPIYDCIVPHLHPMNNTLSIWQSEWRPEFSECMSDVFAEKRSRKGK